MGFSKSNVEKVIRIPMDFRQVYYEGDKFVGQEQVTVVHVMNYPTIESRELREQEVVKVKGKRVKARRSAGDFNYWFRNLHHVEGYEDDGITADTPKAVVREYFSDAIGRQHVDECVGRYDDIISAEDSDREKKSELSPEELSGTSQEIPMSETV